MALNKENSEVSDNGLLCLYLSQIVNYLEFLNGLLGFCQPLEKQRFQFILGVTYLSNNSFFLRIRTFDLINWGRGW